MVRFVNDEVVVIRQNPCAIIVVLANGKIAEKQVVVDNQQVCLAHLSARVEIEAGTVSGTLAAEAIVPVGRDFVPDLWEGLPRQICTAAILCVFCPFLNLRYLLYLFHCIKQPALRHE